MNKMSKILIISFFFFCFGSGLFSISFALLDRAVHQQSRTTPTTLLQCGEGRTKEVNNWQVKCQTKSKRSHSRAEKSYIYNTQIPRILHPSSLHKKVLELEEIENASDYKRDRLWMVKMRILTAPK